MKRFTISFLLFFTFFLLNAQFRSIGIIAGVGHTFVDVEKAVDWYDLEEWDNVGVIIKGTGDFELKNDLILYVEIGATRLYYWEYRWSDGYYSGYRYRSEWTTNIQVHLKKYFADQWFAQLGPGIHFFNDGSGTVPGITLAGGYEIELTDELHIPLGIRIESVFGSATPTALMLNFGMTYDISDLF